MHTQHRGFTQEEASLLFSGKSIRIRKHTHTKKINHKHHNDSHPHSLAACTNNIKQDFIMWQISLGQLFMSCLLWTLRNKSYNLFISIIIMLFYRIWKWIQVQGAQHFHQNWDGSINIWRVMSHDGECVCVWLGYLTLGTSLESQSVYITTGQVLRVFQSFCLLTGFHTVLGRIQQKIVGRWGVGERKKSLILRWMQAFNSRLQGAIFETQASVSMHHRRIWLYSYFWRFCW